MDSPSSLLEMWRRTEPTEVPCREVRTQEALQPRVQRLAPYRDWPRLEDASEDHVAVMRSRLAANSAVELEPVLVAQVDASLLLVDGHHRLRAYIAERRTTIPARILQVTLRQAILASKLANLDGAKLPLHSEQRRDAAWQYLAELTHSGALSLPDGESLRSVGARFGIAANTVRAMLKKLPEVDPSSYSEEAFDPGLRWPRWKYVRESAWKGGLDAMPADMRAEWRAEKVAAQLARVMERADVDIVLRALTLLCGEARAMKDSRVRAQVEELHNEIDGLAPDF